MDVSVCILTVVEARLFRLVNELRVQSVDIVLAQSTLIAQ